MRVRRDVRERNELPPSPRQVRERAGELDPEERARPGAVEDLARARGPERHVARGQRARGELQEGGVERVCERDGWVCGEERAELFVWNTSQQGSDGKGKQLIEKRMDYTVVASDEQCGTSNGTEARP